MFQSNSVYYFVSLYFVYKHHSHIDYSFSWYWKYLGIFGDDIKFACTIRTMWMVHAQKYASDKQQIRILKKLLLYQALVSLLWNPDWQDHYHNIAIITMSQLYDWFEVADLNCRIWNVKKYRPLFIQCQHNIIIN